MNVQTETLWRALTFVTPFASRDDTRPTIYGVSIYAIHDTDGQRIVVEATDGYTVGVYERRESYGDDVPWLNEGSVERVDLRTDTAVAFVAKIGKLTTAAKRARRKNGIVSVSAIRVTKDGTITLRGGHRDKSVLLKGAPRKEDPIAIHRVWPSIERDPTEDILMNPVYGERAFRGFRRLGITSVKWDHSGNAASPIMVSSVNSFPDERSGLMSDESCAALMMPMRCFDEGSAFPYPRLTAIVAQPYANPEAAE